MKKTTLAAVLAISALALASCASGSPSASPSNAPRVSTVSKDIESPVIGAKDAKVVVKIFSDYQCPACQRFHSLIEGKLRTEYADAGKLAIEYKNYPLPQHQNAEGDALGAICALPQGKFLEFSDKMYVLEGAKMNADVTDAERVEVAKFAGVPNLAEFETCLKEGWYLDRIAKDKKDGDRLGLDHTPSIYVNDKIVDFKSVEEFFSIIDASIAAAK